MPSFRLWLLKHPDKDPATAVLYTVITAGSQNAAIELVTERIRLQRPDIDLDEDYFFVVSKTPEGRDVRRTGLRDSLVQEVPFFWLSGENARIELRCVNHRTTVEGDGALSIARCLRDRWIAEWRSWHPRFAAEPDTLRLGSYVHRGRVRPGSRAAIAPGDRAGSATLLSVRSRV